MPIRRPPHRAQELIVERQYLRDYNSRKQVRMMVSAGTEARSASLGCLRIVAEPTTGTRQDLYPLTRAISPDSVLLLNSTKPRQRDERRAAKHNVSEYGVPNSARPNSEGAGGQRPPKTLLT